MENIHPPVIKKVKYGKSFISEIAKSFSDIENNELLLDYPTVYIIDDKTSKDKYAVYVG